MKPRIAFLTLGVDDLDACSCFTGTA